MEKLDIATVKWEFEDQLPQISYSDFEEIFRASRVRDGVRMYPFIENDDTSRVWLTE